MPQHPRGSEDHAKEMLHRTSTDTTLILINAGDMAAELHPREDVLEAILLPLLLCPDVL